MAASDEFKDISQSEGSALAASGNQYESKMKEYHHPDLYKFATDRPYDLENLCKAWDGKQVWAVIDPATPIWRQATVLCAVPAEIEGPGGKFGEWKFVLDTKHDNWRHVIYKKPTDETFLSFDDVQVTEYALLPGKETPNRLYEAPEYFELEPDGSPVLSVAKGATPVHPWIADELRAMRKLCDELKKENERLNKDLAAAKAEIEERRLNEERLAKLLQKEKDERKIAEDKLNRQILILREKERELMEKIGSLKDLINELQGEVNALTSKNAILTKDNEDLVASLAEVKQENEELNALVGGVQNALRVSNKDRADLEEENRVLRDRIQALDEALQKTIDSANQAAHEMALKHGMEKVSMQAEIDRLRELLGSGAGTTTTTVVGFGSEEEFLELRKKLAVALKEVEDKKDLLNQSFEEIKRLKDLIELYAGVDWKKIYQDIKNLSERCGVLEIEHHWKAGSVGPITYDDDDEFSKYKIYDGDEERALKRKDKADRKKARALVRLCAALVGEVNGVDSRIVELEKKLEHIPRAPPQDKVVVSPSAYTGADRFLKVNKSDWLSQQMQLQFLTNSKDTKPVSEGDVQVLQAQVAYLVQRNQDLLDIANGFADGKPQYTPTYKRLLRGLFGNKYDGNFPWLLTARTFTLEKENTELIKKMDVAAGRHLQVADNAESLMQPVLNENAALREKLLLYRAKLDEYESSFKSTGPSTSAASAQGSAAPASGIFDMISSGMSDATKAVGFSQ